VPSVLFNVIADSSTGDSQNRLQTVTNTHTGEVTFTYDADGQRVKRDTVTNTIVYVGSHYEALIEEQDIAEDLDGDCLITVIDIMLVVAHWGCTCCEDDCYDPLYDLDGNEVIDIADVMQVALHWRETCEELAETVKYYTLGGRRVAMRRKPEGQAATLYYLFSDHLGSSNVVYNTATQQADTIRYYPYGSTRSGGVPTDRLFTGQRFDSYTQLYQMGARWYDVSLGRFVQPDSLVQADAKNPAPYLLLAVSYANPKILEQWNQLQRSRLQPEAQAPNTPFALDPQFLNRYTYARNNPLAYVDDSGYIAWWIVGGIVGGIVGFGAYAITHRDNLDWREAAVWTAGGAVVGGTLGAGAQWVAGALGTEAAVTAGAATTAGTAAAPRGLSALSRAAEFGIRSYNELRTLIAGTGLRAHHIIEQRFASIFGLRPGHMQSVALTPEEHQIFTNMWRAEIGYSNSTQAITTLNATAEQIWAAAQRIYAQYPELLEAARLTIFGE
jgi:RHS repeat-associated protein